MKKAPPQTSPGKQLQEEHDHPKEAWFLHVRLEKVGSARFHLLPRVLGATAGRHRLEWPKSAKAQAPLRIVGRQCLHPPAAMG